MIFLILRRYGYEAYTGKGEGDTEKAYHGGAPVYPCACRQLRHGREYWKAIGYLHDVDYEKFPEEHCKHVRELLAPEGVDEEDIRTIISHGYGICTDEVRPETDIQKSLFAVDELTGIVMACALMRPAGITDLEVGSLKKKFKDKKFAAKCSREIIKQGAEMLDMPLETLMELTIKGMKTEADALGLGAKE